MMRGVTMSKNKGLLLGLLFAFLLLIIVGGVIAYLSMVDAKEDNGNFKYAVECTVEVKQGLLGIGGRSLGDVTCDKLDKCGILEDALHSIFSYHGYVRLYSQSGNLVDKTDYTTNPLTGGNDVVTLRGCTGYASGTIKLYDTDDNLIEEKEVTYN